MVSDGGCSAEMRERPARTHIPIATKRAVFERQDGICQCGCKTEIWTGRKCNVEWDHMPALRLRNINRDGTDYDPPQNDPRYLVARCKDSHAIKTRGAGATTAGTDIGAIKKERRRGRKMKPKQKIPSRPMGKGRRFQKRVKR